VYTVNLTCVTPDAAEAVVREGSWRRGLAQRNDLTFIVRLDVSDPGYALQLLSWAVCMGHVDEYEARRMSGHIEGMSHG